MIEFNLNNKDYIIPDYLNIEDYVKIFKIKDLFEDEYLKARVIHLLTGCSIKDLMDAENHQIDFLSTSIFAMVPRTPYNLIDRFEIDGVHYGYLPSYKQITFAEFVDLDTLLTRTPEQIMDNLHIIAAIMFRPIISEKSKHNFKIEKYDSSTVDERAELFKKKLDARIILGGQFFFINFERTSSNFIRLSLKQKIQMDMMTLKILWLNRHLIWRLVLKKDLGGMLSLIESQIITYKYTMLSLKKK